MLIFHYNEPRFLAGVSKHGFPGEHGLRLLHTGHATTPFGERWRNSPALASARESRRPYLIDRIAGGMPFQSLDGVTDVARALKDDPNFLGFQVHEWDNTPLHDYNRINQEFFDKGIPFTEANFAPYAGRTKRLYLSGGDYNFYRDLHPSLNSMEDVKRYLEKYFIRMVELTGGQVLSVNGHGQFPHAALRLGGKNVMAELGNQVPLSAFQISCVRGAGREFNKPFGVYYETWGGQPFSCTCATSFSPWLPGEGQFQAFENYGGARPEGGSGRSLHRRLLHHAWLSGAHWWAVEWGAENYFSDWDRHPLTEYGRITLAVSQLARDVGPIQPIVPAALVLPPHAIGIDVAYISGLRRTVLDIADPDPCHALLKQWAVEMLSPQPWRQGFDAFNLTPSPWVGGIDVLSAEAPAALLSQYDVVMYVDEKERARADHPKALGVDAESARAGQAVIRRRWPIRVDGEVGCAQAHAGDRLLVGVFNNMGMTKVDGRESGDPQFARTATLTGACDDMRSLCGEQYVRRQSGRVSIELPPGGLAVLSFARG